MTDSLNRQTAKGVSWAFIETASVYTVRFVVGIILARLLFPSDFGLIGMITIFISISDVFVNAGFGQAFIQKKDATRQDANTVFVINFTLGLFVYAILFFAAPLIADFFNKPILVPLVRALTIVVLINSLNVIQHAMIRKDLQFKKRAILTVSSSAVSGGIGIAFAYNGFGVWSLVIQQLCNRGILCLLLYIFSKWHLVFSFSKASAKAMFSFGGWTLLSNLMLSIMNNIYRFSIGKLYSASELGLYERARQFEAMISDTFTWMFGVVAFPVFSKIQNETDRLKATTYNFIFYSTLMIYPIIMCLLIVAKPFVVLIITEKWLPSVPYLQLLCIVGLITPVNYFISPLLQSIGEARKVFFYTIFIGILRIINIFVASHWGIRGIIIGEIIVLSLSTCLMSLYMRRLIGFKYLAVLSRMKWIVLAVIVAGIAAKFTLTTLDECHNLIQVVIPCMVLLIIYAGIMLIFERQNTLKILSVIQSKGK